VVFEALGYGSTCNLFFFFFLDGLKLVTKYFLLLPARQVGEAI
jgi:hypothetical protein